MKLFTSPTGQEKEKMDRMGEGKQRHIWNTQYGVTAMSWLSMVINNRVYTHIHNLDVQEK